jgi:hypothetical protein
MISKSMQYPRIKTLSTLAISEKFDGKSRPVFDRIESFDDYIIHVCKKKRKVTYFMCIIGYNSLYLCIMIQ